MKIAILTIHHVPNYGAMMQAYALKNSVEKLGFDCDVVNYQPDTATEFYKKLKGKFPRSIVRGLQRWRFQRFIAKHTLGGNSSVQRTTEQVFESLLDYDCVICGSDQIWNADGFRGLDATFFLGSADLPNTKKISYAASIGSTDPLSYPENWPVCGDWLQKFDAISVRDTNSAKMVESFGLAAPQLVCDPTLLPSALGEFSSGQKTDRNRLLLYGPPHAEYASSVRSIAETNNLEVVSVGSRCKFADRSFFFADPKEWVGLFSTAKVVVTRFFHGVQLSILNEALPFYIGSPEKRAKVSDSLSRYGLEAQWTESPDALNKDSVEAGLAKMKEVGSRRKKVAEESLSWLESQLK